jgi:hypothetical protein
VNTLAATGSPASRNRPSWPPSMPPGSPPELLHAHPKAQKQNTDGLQRNHDL